MGFTRSLCYAQDVAPGRVLPWEAEKGGVPPLVWERDGICKGADSASLIASQTHYRIDSSLSKEQIATGSLEACDSLQPSASLLAGHCKGFVGGFTSDDSWLGDYLPLLSKSSSAAALYQCNSANQHSASADEKGGQAFHFSSNNDFYHLLQRCIDKNDRTGGSCIHHLIVQYGLDSDVFLGCHLIRMFTAFDSLSKAKQVFDKIPEPNEYTWRAIISSYCKLGQNEIAIELFHYMQKEGVIPNEHIFVAVLEACASARAMVEGIMIHACAVDCGLDMHVFVANTLIDMYAKCGGLADACIIFDKLPKRDIVTWNAMLAGLSQNEQCEEALLLFQKMHQQRMVDPTQATLVYVLKACSRVEHLQHGKLIHFYSIECGVESDLFLSSSLVDMYGKCGRVEDSRAVFEGLPKKDLVVWNACIGGYALHGHGQEALQLLSQMQQEGKEPNEVTFSCILKACSSLGALQQGQMVHMKVVERGFESNVFIGSALIDMYFKCGSLHDACTVFDRLPKRDTVTWSAMITGFSLNGNHSMALQCLTSMQEAGLKLSSVTFLCFFQAYSHLGLVEEGLNHFKAMREQYGIVPTTEHFNSMVELFGKASLLSEAEDLLETMQARSNLAGWRSLLNSCRRTQGYVHVGSRCFDRVVAMDCGQAAGYLLMSNIYAHAGMHKEAKEVERMRRCANALKKPGKAFIEVNRVVHVFSVDDEIHPQSDIVHEKLKEISMQMKQEGYNPCLDLILDSVTDDEKEDVLSGHCERLALAFGLLSTPSGTSIRILKNLRMCSDCHAATKIISKIELRQIFVSDAYCIHLFTDGECSCKDLY